MEGSTLKFDEENLSSKLKVRSKFQRHVQVLVWKSYVQRQRRWRLLVAETIIAALFFVLAVFITKPVFLTPLQAEPVAPITTKDMMKTFHSNSILGFAPDDEPYVTVMRRAAQLLEHEIIGAKTEEKLSNNLFLMSQQKKISETVIWIIWKPTVDERWRFSIRSTERALYETSKDVTYSNPHLRAGFLAVQMAVSRAIIEYAATEEVPEYIMTLVSMPISPLMQEEKVSRALSTILLNFTFALIPPMLEAVALVVHETVSTYKRALRMRGVSYVTMYLSWLVYALLTALPICMLAGLTLIMIFRWIHLVLALALMLAYTTVMIATAFIMAMFHDKSWVACVYTALFTFLQTYLAQLLVYHQYDTENTAFVFLLHVLLPPLGLVHAFDQFALLQTGRFENEGYNVLMCTFGSWITTCVIHFLILMLLQFTVGQQRAIGGQVSWKSIVFKKAKDTSKLHVIKNPTGKEWDQLQEVDPLVAKAISFRGVSKEKTPTQSEMGVNLLNKVTLDMYRGEFTMLFAERIQETMITALENLLTGLTLPDEGTITVLGQGMSADRNLMVMPHMMGNCHRSSFLLDDLTVREHFSLFFDICLWSESREYIYQYSDVRTSRLIEECDLQTVQDCRISELGLYYKAQLCWAIAMLLEPRIIILSHFSDRPVFVSVIRDKIMQHKKYITVVKLCFSSHQLQYADRVFLFDTQILTFGGTPAYLFFKYGRDYRVRLTLSSDRNPENTAQLLTRASEAGGTVRAHLGSLLILRLPASPTGTVASLVKELLDNPAYGVLSMNISVPDSEEVYRRAINESRVATSATAILTDPSIAIAALSRIAESNNWKRNNTPIINVVQFKAIGRKIFYFYRHHKLFFLILFLSAFVAGIMIGLSFSKLLIESERDSAGKKLLHGELLTVEYTNRRTRLIMRSDNSTAALSIANSYIFSEPNATTRQVEKIGYTAIARPESVTEYLVSRAIDAPQLYVYLYAYGIDVLTNANGTLTVNALYCPLHYDNSAAARSMGRSFTALLRHFTNNYAASIQVTDDPLGLDLSPWMLIAQTQPLLIKLLLVLTISHVTLIPSMEHGLIRHTQSHAKNFSPALYWFTLYLWDLIVYWIMIAIMTAMTILIFILMAPPQHFEYKDLLMIPFILVFYGIGCIPHAYIISLGQHVALNSMMYIFVNIFFSEVTVISKVLEGETLDTVLYFLSLSPQFNMAYALVKIKTTFLYNSECIVFKLKNLCSLKMMHKCCEKCGVLQDCFTKKDYMSRVFRQVVALILMAVLTMALLMLIEYRVIERMWNTMQSRWITTKKVRLGETRTLQPGAAREKKDVADKTRQITSRKLNKNKHGQNIDTFGECLLVQDLTKKNMGILVLDSLFFGVGKGDALAVAGLKRHGRQQLCDVLVGYSMPCRGSACCMSKWKLVTQPHKYASQISYSCDKESLPSWMTVRNALEMIGLLRGVPKDHVKAEVTNFIEALQLDGQADTQICDLTRIDGTKVHFAAAVVGAPPVIVVDECTAYQKFSVRRAMYRILLCLRKQGHAIITTASSVETHMPVTSRLALMVDGYIYDIDTIDNLVGRYSDKGFTVVLHLKEEFNVDAMLQKHFKDFVINDKSEVLVNVQILDPDLDWPTIFQKMEHLRAQHLRVLSYIVTVTTIDYIYNTVLLTEKGAKLTGDFYSFLKRSRKLKRKPTPDALERLMPFKSKYDITKLNELPWSVIFRR